MHYADLLDEDAATQAGPPMEGCDEGEDSSRVPSACPLDLLGTFCRLMAVQGWDVSASRMLSDRDHALWQLARARTSDDEELHRLASQLFRWITR